MTQRHSTALSSAALWRTGRHLPPDYVYRAWSPPQPSPAPNWVLRTAVGPAILTGQLAVRSAGAQH
jgi:hypothetical protein